MSTAKVAITIERELLVRLDRLVKSRRFPNRSRAVQEAVTEKLARMERSRGGHDG
jgi:metal-responsive CopG/Arc/MetJ family transcriptional regulator